MMTSFDTSYCRVSYVKSPDQSATKGKVTLAFLKDALEYDLGNYAFVIGDIMPPDLDAARRQTFDINEPGNSDLVTRLFRLAEAECTEALYPFSKNEFRAGETFDDAIMDPESYVIELRLPEDFSRTTLHLLLELIHDYFLCRVLQEWIGLTWPQGAEYWRVRLDWLRTRIKDAIRNRRGPLRRKQCMF